MDKPDTITRQWGNEKSGTDEKIFHPGQLQDDRQLQDDNHQENAKENANEDIDKDINHTEVVLLIPLEGDDTAEFDDIDIDGIDCAEWERNEAGLLKVPEEYKYVVLRQCNDSKVAGHWGRAQTQELVSRNFVWPYWKTDVIHYVATCQKCQRNKADCQAWQTKTIPMPVGNRPFAEIAIDFVGELPESKGYNAILIITDRFTKVQHYIPTNTNWISADVANAYICYIWKLYGLPRHGPRASICFAIYKRAQQKTGYRIASVHHISPSNRWLK